MARFFRYPGGLVAVAAAIPHVAGSLLPWLVIGFAGRDQSEIPIRDGGFGIAMVVAAIGLAVSGWSLATQGRGRSAVLFLSLAVGAQASYDYFFYKDHFIPALRRSPGVHIRIGDGLYLVTGAAVLGLAAALVTGYPFARNEADPASTGPGPIDAGAPTLEGPNT